MQTKPGSSILKFSPDLTTLEGFVRILNANCGTRRAAHGRWEETVGELGRLVDAWRASGPNVSKLFRAELDLSKAAGDLQAILLPTATPRAELVFSTTPSSSRLDKKHHHAFGLFLLFLLNPYNDQLKGPCEYCGKYFLMSKRRKNSRYCSLTCGNRFQSRLSNALRRKAERDIQVKGVQQKIRSWKALGRRGDWRAYVLRRGDITKNFLTRAIREGQIQDPTL
jgi:hypothetical protein